jgi:hypothetical protein
LESERAAKRREKETVFPLRSHHSFFLVEMTSKPPTVKEIASPPPSIFTIGPPIGACAPRGASFVQQCRNAVREGGASDNGGSSYYVSTGVDTANPATEKVRLLAKPPRLPSIPSHADVRFASSTDLVSVAFFKWINMGKLIWNKQGISFNSELEQTLGNRFSSTPKLSA